MCNMYIYILVFDGNLLFNLNQRWLFGDGNIGVAGLKVHDFLVVIAWHRQVHSKLSAHVMSLSS